MITPNGVGLSPDQKTVYVAETHTSRVWAFENRRARRAGNTARTSGGPEKCWVPSPAISSSIVWRSKPAARFCVATIVNGGITAFDLNGEIEHYAFPDPITTNICFGGADMQDAWITCSGTGKLYKARWPRPGLKLNFNA